MAGGVAVAVTGPAAVAVAVPVAFVGPAAVTAAVVFVAVAITGRVAADEGRVCLRGHEWARGSRGRTAAAVGLRSPWPGAPQRRSPRDAQPSSSPPVDPGR